MKFNEKFNNIYLYIGFIITFTTFSAFNGFALNSFVSFQAPEPRYSFYQLIVINLFQILVIPLIVTIILKIKIVNRFLEIKDEKLYKNLILSKLPYIGVLILFTLYNFFKPSLVLESLIAIVSILCLILVIRNYLSLFRVTYFSNNYINVIFSLTIFTLIDTVFSYFIINLETIL